MKPKITIWIDEILYDGVMDSLLANRSSKSLGKMNMNKLMNDITWIKPEDAPLYTPKLASKLTQMPHTVT